MVNTSQIKPSDWAALACAAALMALFVARLAPSLTVAGRHIFLALAITTAFALLGWFTRGVDTSGAIAGFAIAFILAARDLRMFWVLLVVFAVTLLATRAGGDRKRQLRGGEYDVDTTDDRRGRSASQVMANLGIAGLIIALAPMAWSPGALVFAWPVLALAALAEAAADTCSSEIGMAFPGKTVLITTWKPVQPGMDGGISFFGTAAALLTAGVVALAGGALGLVSTRHLLAVVVAGFLASLVDSLLGALLERRGWLNNDAVNLLGTATAVGIAWMLV